MKLCRRAWERGYIAGKLFVVVGGGAAAIIVVVVVVVVYYNIKLIYVTDS